MKKFKQISLILIFTVLLQNCSSTKVLDAWKAEKSVVDLFKKKNVLVVARTANNQARLAFESEIANALRARGIKATESFSKMPNIHPNREMTEERIAFIKEILHNEGFNAIVLTVVKDQKETVRTSTSGVYVGGSYNSYYPSYYGGFHNYYRSPYAYGSYYDSFGGYVPTGSSTSVETEYILETVVYNLDEPTEKQLVAVVTTSIDDPREAYKAAEKYVALMFKHLEDKE